jgi:hypothetical protein
VKTGEKYLNGHGAGNDHEMLELGAAVGIDVPRVNEVTEDDPIVHGGLFAALGLACVLTLLGAVNGAPVPFSKVTEEDQELMTPEEYTAYFEVFQARS